LLTTTATTKTTTTATNATTATSTTTTTTHKQLILQRNVIYSHRKAKTHLFLFNALADGIPDPF
jgi:hypothetical protein